MRCVICRHGELKPGVATVTLERDTSTLVIKGVPALVCDNCDEEYVEDDVTVRLFETAEDALRMGVQFGVRCYMTCS